MDNSLGTLQALREVWGGVVVSRVVGEWARDVAAAWMSRAVRW